MRKKVLLSVLVAALLVPVSSADAGIVIMQCDVGGCGPLQSGWTGLGACGTHTNVAGTGIDVTLATGSPGACECRNPGGTEPLADVEADLLFANDQISTPGGDFIITFANLIAGTGYRLLSYHNRSDEGLSHIEGVVVTGATNVSAPSRIAQEHAIMESPAEVTFTAGAADVSIRYIAPTQAEAGNGAQAFLNGFILEITGPVMQFDSASSAGLESVSPAYLTVILSNEEAGETYTVDYEVVGGTAINGDDYTLAPDTLTFNPGVTTRQIPITIINDGVDEDDETIIVGLLNPTATGGDVSLGGLSQHTYAILDPRPGVGFDTPSSSDFEDVTPVNIAVSLSSPLGQTATVDYAVTGGTATSGTDYTLLGTGTLTFSPWDVIEYISLAIVDDTTVESYETIELTLSNPSSNIKLTTQDQHTYTIVDNEAGMPWDGLMWYYSKDPSTALFVNAQGQLEWSPEKGEQFITRLPEYDLSYNGAVVEISYLWMTDGDHDCPDCFACPDGCYDDSIECIAGTSDMRVGLFEADGEYITADGFDTSSSIFEGYKGYAFRFGPNMKAGPTRWVDCTGEVHKTGNFQKKAASLSNLMTTNDGLEDYIPGFELPPGEWSLFTISLERLSSSSVKTSITLNDRTYDWTDTDDDDQPQKIDVLAVHMRNGRPYSRLVLDTLWQPPPQAWDPYPLDGEEGVPLDLVCTWQPGLNMGNHPGDKHYIYFGTNHDDVNNAIIGSPEYCCFRPVGWEQFDPNMDMGVTIELWRNYYWRIDEKPFGQTPVKGHVWGFSTGLEMMRAGNPNPADGADNVETNVVLSWSAGQNAASHDVYFGTDLDTVTNADILSDEYKGRQDLSDTTYDPIEPLELGKSYYWRIDEVSDYNTARGHVWTFDIKEYVLIDDMESYNPDTHIIDHTWLDSPYPTSDNGASVSLETTIVHGGYKSMEFMFDTAFGTYFNATRIYFDTPDWAGAHHLSLWFHGYPYNLPDDRMYVRLRDWNDQSATVEYGGDPNNITLEQWQEWNILLQDFHDAGVNLQNIREIVIGVESAYWAGYLYFDDIKLYGFRCVPDFRPTADITADCFVNFADFGALADQWLKSPGIPSADIAPDPLDDFVDTWDLAVLADEWLQGTLCPQ